MITRPFDTATHKKVNTVSSAITCVSLTRIGCNVVGEEASPVCITRTWHTYVEYYAISVISVKIQFCMTGQIFFLI
jgi:hypothetical protein